MSTDETRIKMTKRSHALGAPIPSFGFNVMNQSDRIRPLKSFLRNEAIPRGKGDRGPGGKGAVRVHPRGFYQTNPFCDSCPWGAFVVRPRILRNEAISRRKGEREPWGKGAVHDFYQTNPMTSLAHFTPGGTKSALKWKITKRTQLETRNSENLPPGKLDFPAPNYLRFPFHGF